MHVKFYRYKYIIIRERDFCLYNLYQISAFETNHKLHGPRPIPLFGADNLIKACAFNSSQQELKLDLLSYYLVA